jgi:hypothetical protein
VRLFTSGEGERRLPSPDDSRCVVKGGVGGEAACEERELRLEAIPHALFREEMPGL